MPISKVNPVDLRISIDPNSLGFGDTSELQDTALRWIGQQRAEAAARFGLGMDQPGYNLFVLGEIGSGRSSLLLQLMQAVAANRAVPPDLCYLHNFDAPELPRAVRLPAGQGRQLRQRMLQMAKNLQTGIPLQLDGQAFKIESERSKKIYDQPEAKADAQARSITLSGQAVKPLLERELQQVREGLSLQPKDAVKLNAFFDQLSADVLENLDVFQATDDEDEAARLEALAEVLSRLRINLVVDNSQLTGAPVLVDDNPVFRSLFGSIEYQAEDEVLVTDFSRIRAGSLLKAHGGFLMLHLRDLLADEMVWEKLRRFLRSGKLQIEEPGLSLAPMAAVSLAPEQIDVAVKMVLIGSSEHYYTLQELDPESARYFRVKVDFAESFVSNAETRHATAAFVAHTCKTLGLPHFSAGAVARLLEEAHRTVDDQKRQSAIFAHTEAVVTESAALCTARAASVVESTDVEAALIARNLRHDYPEQRLQESISDGERLIAVVGEHVGQLNGLTQIDLGDYRFGFPVRVTAHTFAGDDGLLNIEREVEMSGPIHDKGVLVLHSYLSTLFAHLAPLALNATISFEQEYGGVEGDSASCAELYALLSSLSGLPLKQGIAVTGAVNLHGEVLPVGGVNEKIEGYFRTCETAGLDGHQGVLIPQRNRHHLMLARKVVDAVSKGFFHVYTVDHVSEGIELLTGWPSGLAKKTGVYPRGSVLGLAQKTLQAYRTACQAAEGDPKPTRRRAR
jgi:predicted ATP-dependent protease